MKQMFTDKQIIDSWLETRNYTKGAEILGMNRVPYRARVRTLVEAGVNLPPQATRAVRRLTPQLVNSLNAYVKQRTNA